MACGSVMRGTVMGCRFWRFRRKQAARGRLVVHRPSRPTSAADGFAVSPRKLASRVARPRTQCAADRRSGKFFFDARRLARALAQVIQLGTAHVAAALDFDLRDQRAVELEGALDALTAGDLAHDEAAVEPAVALGDDHAFVGLHPPSGGFPHPYPSPDRVPPGR